MDTFRKVYTPLSDNQKKQMQALKEAAEILESLMDGFVSREKRSERSRCMALARTNLETSVMYAVKAVTTQHESTSDLGTTEA